MNLITGCNSFLSIRISKEYSSENLIGTGRSVWKNANEFISYSDLFNSNREFDTVFHVAAHVPQNSKFTSEQELYNGNVALTETLINKIKFNRMVYASSVSVYGSPVESIIKEDSMLNSPSNYGLSKLWAENLIKNQNNYSIFRLSSIYGEGMNEKTLIPNYVNQALNNGIIEVWGKGERMQNYIHVSDAAMLMKAGANSNVNGTFLGVDEVSHSNIEIAEIISGLTGARIVFTGNDNSKSVHYDNEWTRKTLEWSPKTSILVGISNYIEWKRSQF